MENDIINKNPLISIEALELGYFALNPALDPSRDILLKIIILNILKKNNETKLSALKHSIFKKLRLPDLKLDALIRELIQEEYLSHENGVIIVASQGEKYLSKIENDVRFFLESAESLFKSHGISTEQIPIAYKALDYLASKDSDLFSYLLGIKKEHYTVETENEGLLYITDDKKLIANLVKLINDNIMENDTFRQLFLSLLYGHVAEYLLLSSSDKNLLDIFRMIKSELKEIWIVLDTNIIIALLCHHDPQNRQLTALFDFINKSKNLNAKINFLYHNQTITELNRLLLNLETKANQIAFLDTNEVKKIIQEEGLRSPLRSFYYEKKYRDWDNYVYLFMNAWDMNKSKYSINEISNNIVNNIDKIENDAKRYSKLLFYDDTIPKRQKNLEHDVLLFLLANSLAEKYEKESLMKTVLILSKDTSFELLEQSVNCINNNLTKKSLNLRQLIAYLSPIFSLTQHELKIKDKILFGSLIHQSRFIHQQQLIQKLCISLANTEMKYSLKRLPGDAESEIIKNNLKLSKELMFNLNKKSDEVIT